MCLKGTLRNLFASAVATLLLARHIMADDERAAKAARAKAMVIVFSSPVLLLLANVGLRSS